MSWTRFARKSTILRSRVTSLEYDTDASHTCDAAAAASVAERHLSYARGEWHVAVRELKAGLRQAVSLLAADTDAPARRPENTQSAKDKPLT